MSALCHPCAACSEMCDDKQLDVFSLCGECARFRPDSTVEALSSSEDDDGWSSVDEDEDDDARLQRLEAEQQDWLSEAADL